MTKNVGTIEYTIDAKTDKLLIAGRRADDTFDNIERGAKRADNSISKLNTTISKLAAAVNVGLLMMAAKRFIEIADNVKLLRARVSRLSGSLVEAKANFSGILEISKRTGMKIEDTTKLWESLTSALSDSNATSGQILQLTETLQQIGRIGGSSSEEAANALRQLGQSINGGIVRAEEFNSILESMPELWRRVAGQMGISMGELRRRMLDGKLTAEDVVNAILKGSGEIEKEFNKLPTTTEQALSQLNTDFGLLLETIDQTLHVTELVGRGVKTLADYCRELSGWFKTLKSDSASLADKLWTLAAAFEPFVPGLDLFRAQAKQTDFLGVAPDNQSSGFVSTLPTQQATTDIKLKDNGGGGGNKPKRTQKDPAEEALKRKRAELERLNQGFAEGSKEAEMWDAVQEMGANATAKQVSEMKNLAHLIYETNAAREHQIELEEKAKQLNEQFNPVDALKQRHALEMQQADELFNKQMINEETLNALKQQHAEELLASQWEQFRAQGGINGLIGDMADGLSGGATNAVVGLLNGTQNLETAFANIGTTILGKVVGSIAEMGAEYVKQMILSEAASASAMSGQAATAAATGASIASSMAPAAAATATATMGTAPMIAMSAISALMAGITGLFGGGRYNGGAVGAGNLYRVGEHGKPELFQTNNGRQYMIPGENGRVIPGRDIGGGGGLTLNVTNNIQSNGGWSEEDSKALQQTIESAAMNIIRRESQRPGGMLQPRRR
ncbi:TPA: tape measure protein [Escherichia coli]|uniref:tape measure protein n=1 Tax=Escherichia coli TaxID=562 RepID=UPI00092DB5F6|nr:tape measure protein [Escherichia coli]APJ68198.1 tail tape measure protein [Escherichia coli]APL87478.1 tail tape measure protein [Escherichia coli]EEV6997458.1 tail tape measure protein [Escherichia coli]SQL84920.1 tail component of prophage CP-933X [Escherichia coli]HAM9003016.1 tape measure protein [Escherichia coli]